MIGSGVPRCCESKASRTMTTVHGKRRTQIGLDGRDAAGLMREAASRS